MARVAVIVPGLGWLVELEMERGAGFRIWQGMSYPSYFPFHQQDYTIYFRRFLRSPAVKNVFTYPISQLSYTTKLFIQKYLLLSGETSDHVRKYWYMDGMWFLKVLSSSPVINQLLISYTS